MIKATNGKLVESNYLCICLPVKVLCTLHSVVSSLTSSPLSNSISTITKRPASSLPTELKTERLILRPADVSNNADCLRVNTIRGKVSGGPSHDVKAGAEATRQIRYKHRVRGPSEELCSLATAPANIYWLRWLPPADKEIEKLQDSTNLVGLIAMSFRYEMPYPDMGYMVSASHAGHGYPAEAGKAVLHYWRYMVGVKEIFMACQETNRKSQRCAERIGFVRGGPMMFEERNPLNARLETAVAYNLPGMQRAQGWNARPGQGWPPGR